MNLIDRCHYEITECMQNPISTWAKVVNGLIAFLIVLSVATIPAHFIPDLAYAHDGLVAFDKFVVSIFTVEYFLRLWTAKKPLRYVFSWWGLVDLASILPFYLGQVGLVERPELFLALRILRLFKLGRIYSVAREEISRKAREAHGSFKVIAGETIEYIAQRHWTRYVGGLFFRILLAMISLLAMLLLSPVNFWLGMGVGGSFMFFSLVLFIKLWLDFNYDLIYITNQRVVFQRRELFGANLNEVNYIAITNIKPDTTGLFRWIFNCGDVIIETSAMQGSIVFKHTANPDVVVSEISRNRQHILQKTGASLSVDPLILGGVPAPIVKVNGDDDEVVEV